MLLFGIWAIRIRSCFREPIDLPAGTVIRGGVADAKIALIPGKKRGKPNEESRRSLLRVEGWLRIKICSEATFESAGGVVILDGPPRPCLSMVGFGDIS